MSIILVPTDFSEHSLTALPFARKQAGSDDEVHLVSVVEEENHFFSTLFGEKEEKSDLYDEAEKALLAELDAIAAQYLGGISFQCHLIRSTSRPSADLLKYAEDNQASMIVIASHGRSGFINTIFGSTTERVVHASKIPVLTIPSQQILDGAFPPEDTLNFHILVPIDFSGEAKQSYQVAREQAEIEGRHDPLITLFHVVEDLTRATYHNALGEDVDEIYAELHLRANQAIEQEITEFFPDIPVNSVVVESDEDPYESILNFARHRRVQMIVITTHGRSGIAELIIGSTTLRLIRSSPVPVLVVPSR